MLTRLRVRGFKNLLDCEVHFGPFTCIAGSNGVGKSNLFDAITFLGRLADRPLLDAARSVRDEDGRTTNPQSLFYQSGSYRSESMSFEADLIVPSSGVDDLGQPAEARSTFLTYSLEIRYRAVGENGSSARLEVVSERLSYVKKSDASRHLPFKPGKVWRDSVVIGRSTSDFISTAEGKVKLHQDGNAGRPKEFLASLLPRTILSASADASEAPTVALARSEMRSWWLLQLEPRKLRRVDGFDEPTSIGSDGSHVAATLHRLIGESTPGLSGVQTRDVASEIANRLAGLVQDVREVRIDRDEKRQIYALEAAGRDGTFHPARSLSDGTLRFLALAVMEQDPRLPGVLCMEEPENGIHPERVRKIVELLRDFVVDVHCETGVDNPLRQVIVNTHSPIVVAQVPEDSVIFLEPREVVTPGERLPTVAARCLSGTWREKLGYVPMPLGKLLVYLNSARTATSAGDPDVSSEQCKKVIDRDDVQLAIDFGAEGSRDA